MIKIENGNVEMSGIGKELIKDFVSLVRTLYQTNLMTDELYCEIGSGISFMKDIGLLKQRGSSIQIDLDELKKQMGGEK